jgi:hypothetical protein
MDIPLEQLFTTNLINKNEIYSMQVKFLYIPESLVTNFFLMHEIDKMQKIENSKTQSHTIDKIKQMFSLGNHYRIKPS